MTTKWTEGGACRSRQHCDGCLGNAAWRKGQLAILDEKGIPAWSDFPPLGKCPYGETLRAAKGRRAALLVRRVANGRVTLDEAVTAAEALGLELDTPTKT